MRNRRGLVLLATCAVAGCVDRTDDAPLFGGDEIGRDELAVDVDGLAADTHVEVAPTIAAVPRPGDRDGDFLADEIDTCPDVEDSSNVDTDLDGLGNACDADYDNNGAVTGSDYAVLLASFGRSRGDAAYDARVDHDHNGTITGTDFATFVRYFGASSPSNPSTIPLQQVAVGDTFATTTRILSGTAIGTSIMRSIVSSVERDANGRVAAIIAGGIRLTPWTSEAWLIEGLLVSASDTGFGAFGLCPRAVWFPARPIDSLSQFCTSTTYQSFALAISRS